MSCQLLGMRYQVKSSSNSVTSLQSNTKCLGLGWEEDIKDIVKLVFRLETALRLCSGELSSNVVG